jgi:hypothetical protein
MEGINHNNRRDLYLEAKRFISILVFIRIPVGGTEKKGVLRLAFKLPK